MGSPSTTEAPSPFNFFSSHLCSTRSRRGDLPYTRSTDSGRPHSNRGHSHCLSSHLFPHSIANQHLPVCSLYWVDGRWNGFPSFHARDRSLRRNRLWPQRHRRRAFDGGRHVSLVCSSLGRGYWLCLRCNQWVNCQFSACPNHHCYARHPFDVYSPGVDRLKRPSHRKPANKQLVLPSSWRHSLRTADVYLDVHHFDHCRPHAVSPHSLWVTSTNNRFQSRGSTRPRPSGCARAAGRTHVSRPYGLDHRGCNVRLPSSGRSHDRRWVRIGGHCRRNRRRHSSLRRAGQRDWCRNWGPGDLLDLDWARAVRSNRGLDRIRHGGNHHRCRRSGLIPATQTSCGGNLNDAPSTRHLQHGVKHQRAI